jgi:signal transduction histidine kinase
MKISTKIISGYGILIAMIAVLLLYQQHSIRAMQGIVTKLSSVNIPAANFSLGLKRDIELVDEFTKKSFALKDPEYRQKLAEVCSTFVAELRDVDGIKSTDKERSSVAQLQDAWNRFSDALQEHLQEPFPEDGRAPEALLEQISQLRTLTEGVYQAARNGIDEQVRNSKRDATWAVILSRILAAVALVLSILVSIFVVHSISSPLKQLTQGTRSISEGKFFYRLDTTRSDEFGQLAKDFNTMTSRLNELDQMKKDFVAHVSHELKAPLASMQETNRLLLELIPGPLTDKQRRLLELNLAGGQRLSAMIGNLLDLSRMEAGVMEYELNANDLADLVRNAAADLQAGASERSLEVKLEIPEQPMMVECDGDRILEVIRNLIGNAIKFSPRGSEIHVLAKTVDAPPPGMPAVWRNRVATAGNGRGFILLSVSDSGPGVPDEHKGKIFEKFHQVKQGKKLPGQGAGLGLAISRTITEAHRGALWVEDNPGGGSVFFLLIPPGESGPGTTYRASTPI